MELKISPMAMFHRVLTDELQRFLILRRGRILHPEQMMWFEALAEPAGLNRRQAVMHIVEKMKVRAVGDTNGFEQLRREVEVFLGRRDVLLGEALRGRFVEELAAGDTVGGVQTRDARLRPHDLVAKFQVLATASTVSGMSRPLAWP
jgi:hypothetical protein